MQQILPAYKRLEAHKEVVFERWIERARAEVKAANQQERPVLLNSFPTIFSHLISALNPACGEDPSSETKTLASEHGKQRANIDKYSLDQVLVEYGLLQDVILESFRGVGAIGVEDCTKISRFFLEATRAAASGFVEAKEEQRQESEIQFERIVKDAKDLAIFSISPEGIIQSWNEGATRIKQFTAEDAVGNHYRMLFREEDREQGRPEHSLKLAIENGRFVEQWWRIKKDGTLWWAEAILTAVYSNSGKLVAITKIVRDLTEKKKVDDELREAKAAAETANTLKSTFVANMSHEIRTPLGAILGFAKILAEAELTAEERLEYAGVIERNGTVLLRLIDDILDISKIEAGKLEIENVQIPLRNVLPEVVGLFEIRAKEKGISLDLDISSEVPDYITTDPLRLRQIVTNLISNAVKFTSKGNVHVFVVPQENKEKMTGIEIIVTDSGPGIPKDKLNRIFGEFSQVDASITRNYGGSGLGLALSRRLARELGGDLELVNCDVGVGCTFKATVADCEEGGGNSEREKEEVAAWKAVQKEVELHPHLNGSHILLVEDSSDNQLLVKKILSDVGAQVEFASNGEEGVQMASAGDFDVVLMDVQMPIMDGNAATRELRRRGYSKPIISLTAHVMMNDRLESLAAGCDDYLSKPIDSNKLLNILEKWVSQARHH